MKVLIQLFLLFPFLVCSQVNHISNLDKVITITGLISNPSSKTVNIIALELMGRENHLARLDSTGSFQIQIPMLSAHNNYLQHDGSLIQFFAEPGDSIHLEADADDFENSARLLGDNEAFNKSLKSFGIILGRNMGEFRLFDNKLNAAPEKYLQVMGDFFDQTQLDIDSIGASMKADHLTIDWMKARVKYWIYDELFEYGNQHKQEIQNPEAQEIAVDYYDFANKYEGSILSDLRCSRYYESFLSEYYEQKIWESLEPYKQLIDSGLYDEGFKLAVEIHEEIVDDQISRELLLTRRLNEILNLGIRPSDDVLQLFYGSVETKIFREIIRYSLQDTAPDESKTISDLSWLEHVGVVFREIQKHHANKVLYIDLWGTWCGPCIQEFSASRKLYESINKNLVEFVYLGVSSEKTNWKQGIEKYGLRGTHFLLTSDQYAELREHFNINGIPRYIIIDKSGLIIDEDATRPRDPMLKRQLLTLADG